MREKRLKNVWKKKFGKMLEKKVWSNVRKTKSEKCLKKMSEKEKRLKNVGQQKSKQCLKKLKKKSLKKTL